MRIISSCTNSLGTLPAFGDLRVSDRSDMHLGKCGRFYQFEVIGSDPDAAPEFHGMLTYTTTGRVMVQMYRKGRCVSVKHHKTVWLQVVELFLASMDREVLLWDAASAEATSKPVTYVEVQLPFEGGFNSSLEEQMDHELEMAQDEDGEPVPSYITDYRDYIIECGKQTIHRLNGWAPTTNGKPLFSYSDLLSPQEYNFSTDRLIGKVSLRQASVLWEMVMDGSYRGPRANAIRQAVLKRASEELTPRSGFIPHYDTDLLSWAQEFTPLTLPACLWGIMFRGFLEVLWKEQTSGCYETLEEELFAQVLDYVSSNGIAGNFIAPDEAKEG